MRNVNHQSAALAVACVLAAVCAVATLSCAVAGRPAGHPVEPSASHEAAGHVLLGMYEVEIDLATLSAEAVPTRGASAHFDVTRFLKPPYCPDCFKIKVIDLDWDNLEVTADVTVKNFTKGLDGYDVRGIVYPCGDFILKNSYAYTLLHAPDGETDPSGFRAYDTADPERKMGPSESATETFIIGFPEGAKFVDLLYAIDASWPDHCAEPYDIHDFEQSGLDVVPGASAQVTVYVSDWQSDTSEVTINTEILGGSDVALSHYSGEVWSGTIANELGVSPGTYPCMITGLDQSTATSLYQWVGVSVRDFGDLEPPVWDDEVGIISASPGLAGILIEFGTASDPSEPVTYNLYWAEGETLDFGTANKVKGIEASPYFLRSLKAGAHTLCLRAQDLNGNETTNDELTTVVVGEHPNVWWKRGADMPTPRGYAGGFLAGGFFWVLGGSAAGTMLDTVERYDIARGIWDSPWSLPEPRDSFGCGALRGIAYIFGGRFSETDVTDSCRVIDLVDGSVLPSSPTLPMPLANMGCALLDLTFYLAGGRHFTGTEWVNHREAFCLTPPATEFVGETDLEFETSMMAFASGTSIYDGYLISCGGSPDRQDVLYHVPGTKSWQFRAPLSTGRAGNVGVWADGWFYTIGGDFGWTSMRIVDVYNVETDTWYSANALGTPRAVATAATDGEFIYVAGGIQSVGPALIPLASLEIGRIY